MKPVLILALCGLLIYCAALWPGPQARAQTPQDPSGDGPKLFARHCAVCHGNEGGGDGGAAYLMLPRPRDFTRGEFRLITTDNGVPTNEDLFRVITNGMPGSAMPPWDRLPKEQRRLLAAEVKRLWVEAKRKAFEEEGVEADELKEYMKEDTTPGNPISFAGARDASVAEIARGRIIYSRACASCHGPEGRGQTTQVLKDSRGNPAPARDFTKGIFKGGSEGQQIYARLRAGMKGTAMPTFKEGGLGTEDAWAVVNYIRSLFPPGAQLRQKQATQRLVIKKVATLPTKEQEWWRATPSAYVPLMPLWWRDRRIEGVILQAAHDGKTLALRLVWEDATQNDRNLLQRDFHDGAAVQLSWDADPPFFGMGDASAPVTIWSWKASWQADLEGFHDLETYYPNMHLDSYFPVQKNLKAGERPTRGAVSARHHDPLYLSGWGAGNPVSNPERSSAVEVISAKGQGTVTTEKRESQTVRGHGVWDRGVWSLTLKADLPPERCRGLFIGLAVWDGAQGDRNGQKSVSIWHHLDLE